MLACFPIPQHHSLDLFSKLIPYSSVLSLSMAAIKSSIPFLLLPLISILLITTGHLHVEASRHSTFQPAKLFVFGDSYADTGNGAISNASSWKVPYGMTFPGKPAGRFSDGCVFTDLFAKYLGLKTPVAYRRRKFASIAAKKYGMNFATGGSGVFDTVLVPGPNMTTQIDEFKNVVNAGYFYTENDINSSIALVALSGNDYSSYLSKNGSVEGLPSFITQVVNQLSLNIARIKALGVRKVVVSGLQPLGCIPEITYPNGFQRCNSTFNELVTYHNQLLQVVVDKFNNESGSSSFVIIDLYSAFTAVIEGKGNSTVGTPLVPCCEGVSEKYSCGSVEEETGEEKYTVCSDPKAAFFWDGAHPTQEGWLNVFSALKLQRVLE